MTEVQHYHHYDAPPIKQNAACIAALVLGICTFFTFGATGIPALWLGIVGYRQIKEGKADAQGMAVTGIVLGGLACAGWVMFWLFYAIGTATS